MVASVEDAKKIMCPFLSGLVTDTIPTLVEPHASHSSPSTFTSEMTFYCRADKCMAWDWNDGMTMGQCLRITQYA